MIIVNQDKTKILNFNNITEIFMGYANDKKRSIRCETLGETYEDLGTYKTEERVKEILKEIWDLYEDAKRYEVNVKVGIVVCFGNKFVYEMPEE